MKHSLFHRFLYRSYRFFYRSGVWWRRKVTPAGFFAVCVVVCSAILGVDTTQNMIYQVFTFFVPLVIIAFILCLSFRADFDVARELPRYATVGKTLHYRIRVKNKSNRPQKGVTLYENPADPRPSLGEFLAEREPGEENRNIWDRTLLYYRWLWLVRKNQKAWFPEIKMPDLLPGDTGYADATCIPHNRGYIYFDGVTFTRTDPVNLFKGLQTIQSCRKVLVLPKQYNVPQLKLPGTREYHSGGVALASSVGNSDEFVSLRPYRPGDPIKHIHWKSMAKKGELIIKEYQDEFYVRHGLILDTFHDASEREAFETAVSIATSFVTTMDAGESILDLMFVGKHAYCFTSGRGLSTTDKMVEILACVQGGTDTSIAELIPLLAGHAHLMSACVCVLLAWDKQRKAVVETMTSRSIPVKVIIVTANKNSVDSEHEFVHGGFHVIETGNVKEGLKHL